MAGSGDTITITCPLCGKDHIYSMEVDTSTGMFNVPRAPESTRVMPRRYKRIFTCPEKNAEFEAELEEE